HAPEAYRAEVAKINHQIKNQAWETRDKPVKIVQDNLINACRRKIHRVKQGNSLPQPQDITVFSIPEFLQVTLNSNFFLISDQLVNQDQILLYIIHAPIGTTNNSRILLLIYSLMLCKSEEQYIWLFESLVNFANENKIELSPPRIITDFELAAINTLQYVFPEVINKACFFYLGQNGWKQVQKCELAEMPQDKGSKKLVLWFEENYVLGKIKRETRKISRTQNIVEGWHNRWAILV
ncbi:1773_t:CDS:2, partial [Dentiscutata erythropus]